MEWNYISNKKKSTGYEDVFEELKSYTSYEYKNASPDRKLEMVDSVFNIYRRKSIYPITYFNDEGISDEIIKARDKDVSFDGNVLNLKYNQGSALCKFMQPNLLKVVCKGAKDNTLYDKFNSDYKLKKAITFCLKFKKNCTPTSVRDGLEMIGGNVATNFKAMNAKALYEKYCPKDGVIYDFACGFGGRMVGALTSKNNYKYIGVEPCTETYNNLLKLGGHIDRTLGGNSRFLVLKLGSEVFGSETKEPFADFAFSSPPYFTLEKYSDEESQCYIKYPTLDLWFKNYVEPTIRNINNILKKGSYYAVNIADFKIGKKDIEYVNHWIDISKSFGFEYVEQIHMKLQTRRGAGHDKSNLRSKKEGIFIFKKIN